MEFQIVTCVEGNETIILPKIRIEYDASNVEGVLVSSWSCSFKVNTHATASVVQTGGIHTIVHCEECKLPHAHRLVWNFKLPPVGYVKCWV